MCCSFISYYPEESGYPWWRHQMETFFALLALCAGNSPVTGKFPSQRVATWSLDAWFDLRLNKRLSKPSGRWWFETPWRSYDVTLTACKTCNDRNPAWHTLIYPHHEKVIEWSNIIFSTISSNLYQLQCNTLRPRHICRHFADDIFKYMFLNENVSIPLKMSLKFVSPVRINNIPALVQIIATSHYLNQRWLVYWCIYSSLKFWNGWVISANAL